MDAATKEAAEGVEYIKDDNRIEGDYKTVGDWVDKIVDEAVVERLRILDMI